MTETDTKLDHNAYDENLKFIERIANRATFNSHASPWPKNIIYAMAGEIVRLRKQVDEMARPWRERIERGERDLAHAEEDLRRLRLNPDDLIARMGGRDYAIALGQAQKNVATLKPYVACIRANPYS